MAKKKSSASAVNSQLKNSLSQLKKLGLYNPKSPRKAPTKYAKSLVKKYADVIGSKPKAEVVKVPASVAKEFAGQYRTKRTKKGAAVIVPKAGGMKARYSKSAGTIVRSAGAFTLTPYNDRLILLRGGFPELKKGETVVVRIGNNFVDFGSIDEVRAAMAQYDPNQTTLWQYPYIGRVKRKR